MPTERRRIIFSDDEVVDAALSYCRATGIAVPDAEIDERSVATDTDCSLVLTFAVASPDQRDEVEMGGDSVLNALVAFCRMQSIPLPKSAAKRLEAYDGAVSMVFDMKRERGSVNRTLAA
jgi:hypothetical protein